MARILDRIDRPQDLHELTDDELVQVAQEVREHIIDTVGEIGGHFGANLGTCELAVALHSLLDSPKDKILWDVGHQAYPHKVLTGRRDQLPDDPPVRGPRAVLLDRRVRARHHGRRPRLDLDRLRRRPQGGHAPARRARRRQGRRGHRRRRDDRRRRLRGDPPGRRPGHADRRRAQRQRHVDRAERRRAVALLQPRPPEPEAVARARGRRGPADRAARRHRRRVRAPRPAAQGVDQGVLGARPARGRSSTGPTSASSTATTSARCARALREALAADRPVVVHIATVKGKGFAPAEDGGLEGMEKLARRQAEARSPTARRGARPSPRPSAGAAAVHEGLRRGDGRGGPPRPRASSASPRR